MIGREDGDKLKPIKLPNGEKAVERAASSWPVLKTSVADEVTSMLSTVVTQGTATRAQIPDTFVAGKTGTTENYGDAWFVGWTDKITVAVWVGYPDELRPMETEFNGQPVAGGTYPAAIWKSFVEQALSYKEYGTDEKKDDERGAARRRTAGRARDPGDDGAGDDRARAGHDGAERAGRRRHRAARPTRRPSRTAPAPDTAPPPAQDQPPAPPPAQQAPPSGDGGAAPPQPLG